MRSEATPSASGEDRAHADVGLVSALRIELAPFLQRCLTPAKYSGGEFTFRGGRFEDARVAIVESGPGFARARRATLALIEAHTPPYIISCGFSGALAPHLEIGHIVMANAICDTHGQELALTLGLPSQLPPGVHAGRLVVADEVVRTVDQKQALGEAHDALAVDLESLAVAQVCRDNGVGFMAVRVISDDLSVDLPQEIHSVLAATPGRRIGAALGSLWKRPSSYKDLLKLRDQARYAAERLSRFLGGVVEQLHDSLPQG